MHSSLSDSVSTPRNNVTPGGSRSGTPTSDRKKKLKPQDFELGATLGEGGYARVVFARCLMPNPPAQVIKRGGDFVTNDFALKIVDKAHLIKHHKAHTIVTEKTIMFAVNHPNIVRLYSTFQDRFSLYLLLELVTKGELYDLIQQYRKLPTKLSQFYAAEIVNVLEYLHKMGIVHRYDAYIVIGACAVSELTCESLSFFLLSGLVSSCNRSQFCFGCASLRACILVNEKFLICISVNPDLYMYEFPSTKHIVHR